MIKMLLSREDYRQVIDHCRKEKPLEACGILAGSKVDDRWLVERVFLMENARPSSEEYFMDYEEQFEVFKEIREEDMELISIFHSHLHSPARPSQKDIDMANYEDAVYTIISLENEEPDMRVYRIEDDDFTTVEWGFTGES
ncbi:MAG: M67 family metallopeptidase [Halanaerobiales bacterium]